MLNIVQISYNHSVNQDWNLLILDDVMKRLLMNRFIRTIVVKTLKAKLKKVIIRYVMISLGLFYVGNSIAEAQRLYTLEDLIRITLDSSPQILVARDQVNATKAKLVTARTIPNPEFEFLAGQQRAVIGLPTTGNISSLTVTQPLDMPYVRTPRVNEAEANIRSSEAALQAFEIEMISKVQQRYIELMRREAESKAAEEDLELTKQILNKMQTRYQIGEIARYDLIRSQTEFLNAQIVYESKKLKVDQARTELRQIVGHHLPDNYQVNLETFRMDDLPAFNALFDEIRTLSPEIRKLKAEIEASESRLVYEKNSRLPKLALKVSQYNDPNFTDRTYGFQINIPLWDVKRGPIIEAEANLSKAKNQLNLQSQSLEQQIETAYKLYQIASYQLKVLDEDVVRLAASAQKIAEVSYRYGERGMLEYLDAQRTFRAARNDLIKAKYDKFSIITEIQRLRVNPEWMKQIERRKI